MHIIYNCLLIIIILFYFCNIVYTTQKLQNTLSTILEKNDQEAINFLSADKIYYNISQNLFEADGNVILLKNNYLSSADKLIYHTTTKDLTILGKVVITNPQGNVIVTEKLFFNKDSSSGYIDKFTSTWGKNIILIGTKGEMINKNNYKFNNIKYTPCPICYKNPQWQITAKNNWINFNDHRVYYRDAAFKVYGIPILKTPYFSHPTPSAPAKSGILVPNIRHKGLKIPLYIRMKPNIDFTITPVLRRHDYIWELETRHLTYYGLYTINASYKANKNSDLEYSIFSEGHFNKESSYLHYNIAQASNKSYLKNYYGVHTPFLTSRISLNQIFPKSYFSIEGLSLQNLRQVTNQKLKDKDFTPSVEFNYNCELVKDSNIFLDMNNRISAFNYDNKQILYNVFQTQIYKTFITDNGHVFTLSGYNKSNLYYNNTDSNNKINFNPELWINHKYPLNGNYQGLNIFLEPKSVLIIDNISAKKLNKHVNNYEDIKYVSLYTNIYTTNTYFNLHDAEKGNRLYYGIEGRVQNDKNKINVYIGSVKNFTYPHRHDIFPITFNIGFDINNIFKANYNFYKTIKGDFLSASIKDEISTKISLNRFLIEVNFLNLYDKSKILPYVVKTTSKKEKQIYVSGTYKISDNWSVGGSIRLGQSDKKNYDKLLDSFHIKYDGACSSIQLTISNDYTTDPKRNIKKQKNNLAVSISLATLNM